jgi:hypothetical protein
VGDVLSGGLATGVLACSVLSASHFKIDLTFRWADSF